MATPVSVYSSSDPLNDLLNVIRVPPDMSGKEWGGFLRDAETLLDNAVYPPQSYPARQDIFRQDEPVRYVYYVLEGEVSQRRLVTDVHEQSSYRLRRERGPGTWLGTFDLLNGQPHSVRAQAAPACTVRAVNASALSQLVSMHPKIRGSLVPYAVMGRLRAMPFMGEMDLTTLSFLADECEMCEYKYRTLIYGAGTRADTIYFIDTGQVELTRHGGQTVWLGNGQAFGFLLDPEVRHGSATAIYTHQATALPSCRIYRIPRKLFIDITSLNPERIGQKLLKDCENTIDGLGVFSQLTADEKRRLLGYCSFNYMPDRRPLLHARKLGDSTWILMPDSWGLLRSTVEQGGRQPVPVCGPGIFNESALLVEQIVQDNLDSEVDSWWLRIHWGDFQNYLKGQAHDLADRLVLSQATRRLLARSKKAKIRRRLYWLPEGEHVDQLQRRHWIATLPKLRPALVAAAILIPVALLLSWIFRSNAVVLLDLWVLVAITVLVLVAWGIWDYWNDYVILTNKRLIHQEKIPLIKESRQEAPLEKVQSADTTYTFWARIFGYGGLKIQTAATVGSIQFNYMPKPKAMSDRINILARHVEQHQLLDDAELAANILERELGLVLDNPPRVTEDEEVVDIPGLRLLRSLHLFSQAKDEPENQGAEAEKEVHYVWRQHWFMLLRRILWPATLLFLNVIFLIAVIIIYSTGEFTEIMLPLAFLAVIIGFGLLGWLFWNIADWHNDTYELTADRVIDVEKKPLFFSEKRRSASLSRIENIDFEIPGPLYTLLGFGNVTIHTAATEGDLTFDWVPKPRKVAEIIDAQKEAARMEQRRDDMRTTMSQVEEMVIARDRTRLR